MEEYVEQLKQINILLKNNPDKEQQDELLSLKANIEELLALANENEDSPRNEESETKNDNLDDEYALFMAEMNKEGAVEEESKASTSRDSQILEELKDIEGKKFRAPHTHQWGQTVYHNAMVSSILPSPSNDEVQVKVLFLNPTHKEMLPCPYFFDTDSDCKFSDEKCRFSHGEILSYSSLQEYVEPDFESLIVGSPVLAKQTDNLWYRGKIRSIGTEHCLVQFDNNINNVRDKNKIEQILFENIHPIEGKNGDNSENGSDKSESEDDIHVENDVEDVINMSLLITPSDRRLGEWEQYTRGIGSKLMEKMGYVVGMGLGTKGRGRVEPVTAVVLPPGKSLDHCMNLREKYGGDKNLFSAERKFQRMKKRKAVQQAAAVKREEKKTDMFSFMNSALSTQSQSSSENLSSYKEMLKNESVKNLNVSNMVAKDNIRKSELEIMKYKSTLERVKDVDSRKQLLDKLRKKEDQLKVFQTCVVYINNEQKHREQKRKMTEF